LCERLGRIKPGKREKMNRKVFLPLQRNIFAILDLLLFVN